MVCEAIANEVSKNMSKWMLLVCGLVYGYVAIDQLIKGNGGMSALNLSYACSNFALMTMVE